MDCTFQTKVGGNSIGPTSDKNVRLGSAAERMVWAAISSPFARTTPIARPWSTLMLAHFGVQADFHAVGFGGLNQRACDTPGLANVLIGKSAAVEPVVDQVEGRARGHDSQRHAVDSERGDRCFQLFGFEPLFHKFDRSHWQGADDVEHVLAAHGAQFESQLGERASLRSGSQVWAGAAWGCGRWHRGRRLLLT